MQVKKRDPLSCLKSLRGRAVMHVCSIDLFGRRMIHVNKKHEVVDKLG